MSVVLVLDQLDRLAVQLVAATNAAIVDVGAGDLSFAQWRMLMVLGAAAEPLRIHEIADRIRASMPSASRLVGRMERRGLVSGSRDPIDGRGRWITLTVDGEALRTKVVSRRRVLIEDSLRSLPADQAMVANLEAIVERMTRWL